MAWRTLSNALQKSKARTATYGLLARLATVIDCNMAISAAVVDPVGRNAYWSVKSSEYGVLQWRGKESFWLESTVSCCPALNTHLDLPVGTQPTGRLCFCFSGHKRSSVFTSMTSPRRYAAKFVCGQAVGHRVGPTSLLNPRLAP